MHLRRPLCFAVLPFLGCCDGEQTEHRWRFSPFPHSAYSATLIEEKDGFALGGTDRYKLRLDAAPRNDDGWFFNTALTADLDSSPRPDVRWATANDIMVVVHSEAVTGQTRRRFGGDGRPTGTLTITYVADQPGE